MYPYGLFCARYLRRFVSNQVNCEPEKSQSEKFVPQGTWDSQMIIIVFSGLTFSGRLS